MTDPDDLDRALRDVAAWAASGAMALTGRPDGPPLGPPAGLVAGLGRVADVLARRSNELGIVIRVDPLRTLAERAAIAGFSRQGRTSCGGATRLLETADGWIAVSLARPDDVDLVPAWLGTAVPGRSDTWGAVADAAACAAAEHLVATGAELGLPVSGLGETVAPEPAAELGNLPVRALRTGDVPSGPLAGARVVDLGALWAGPLCGSLLARAGADVVKVESATRPDGARQGPPAFFDLLNAGKRSVALDFATAQGREQLAALVSTADVVIEASRPRALAQLGVDAEALMHGDGPAVWVSITAHGRSQPERVGFGDDAAVAGGLVAWEEGKPLFCADAVADPATGMVAAAGVMEARARGGRWLLDIAMSEVAAHLAGPTLGGGPGVEVPPPQAPSHPGPSPSIGAHTHEVLAELVTR